MALKAILDSIDGLPEAISKEYIKIEDAQSPHNGKFKLAVEPTGGLELDDVSGLKNALGAARRERDEAKDALGKYGDISPTKAKEGVSALTRLTKFDPEKEADRLAEEKANAKVRQMQDKHLEEVDSLKKGTQRLRGIVEHQLIDSAAKEAILKEKGDPLLLLPHVKQSMRLKEQQDGSFTVEIVDDKGNPRIKDAQGNLMQVADLVGEMKRHESFARAFEGSGASGSGSKPSGNTSSTGTQRSKMNLTEKGDYIATHGYDAFMALPD